MIKNLQKMLAQSVCNMDYFQLLSLSRSLTLSLSVSLCLPLSTSLSVSVILSISLSLSLIVPVLSQSLSLKKKSNKVTWSSPFIKSEARHRYSSSRIHCRHIFFIKKENRRLKTSFFSCGKKTGGGGGFNFWWKCRSATCRENKKPMIWQKLPSDALTASLLIHILL